MNYTSFFLLALLACGCEGDAEKTQRTVLRGDAMGTRWSVILADNPKATEEIRERVVEVIRAVDGAMSTWIDDSEVSRFNRLPAGETMALSVETATVVACAIQIWRDSGGAFDVTVGGQGACADLRLNEPQRTLSKAVDGVTIDLSAIAKGYAVDRVASELDSLGVENYLVEIGGELKGKGQAPEGTAWTVGIERPQEGQWLIAGTVELHDQSIATSGNYRQRRHLIDPTSGEAIERTPTAVCVLHDSAMVADAWATALFVAGPEQAIALADQRHLAVAWLQSQGEEKQPEILLSEAFRDSAASFRSAEN